MAAASGCDRLAKEIDIYASKVYKVDAKDPNYQRLPKCWNSRDRSKYLKLSHFSLTVTYASNCSDRHESNYSSLDPAVVRADAPIPLTTGLYYFEITLSNKNSNGKSFSIGVVTKSSSLSKLPGSEHSSFGYNNDGSICHGSTTSSTKFGPRIVENDTVGCGVDFMSRSLFFTRNGIFLGKAFEGKIPASPSTRLYPAVGLQGRGSRLNANFGQRPFMFAFDAHIARERVMRENHLINRVCKEEFAGSKMRELVSGYLVHHGYVATAQAFSRWASVAVESTEAQSTARDALAMRSTGSTSPTHVDKPSDLAGLQSRSCESHIGSRKPTLPHEPDTPNSSPTQKTSIPRRHSDSSCIDPPSSTMLQLPGLASMMHRRRLRALCKRCQYGKAASTLNHLYPEVLERCPELLVQLRCRQLIEMMRRHAIRRGHSEAFDFVSESLSSGSSIVPPKMKRFSDPRNVRPSCCLANKSIFSVGSSENGTMDMEVDVCMEGSNEPATATNNQLHDDLIDWTECLEPSYADENEEDGLGDEDDDDFGMNDDTGVGAGPIDLGSVNEMEVDMDSSAKITPESHSADHVSSETSELPCLMRHIQFARSLVNLVKEVRVKTGGLSLETERLLQQSVSLLAYSSPTSVNCPLRGLLDPAWRDTIANVINSAVLEAHDLPVQPALEQGLRALQRCFQDQHFVEAQTLGHFLLYHLSPSQLAKADAAARCESTSHRTPKRHRTSPLLSDGATPQPDDTALRSGDADSVNQRSLPNGHVSNARRARRSSGTEGQPSSRSAYDAEGYSSSSSEEVANKADEDEEDEDEDGEEEEEICESGRCRSETIGENEQDDDDDEPGSNRNPGSTGWQQRLHDTSSGNSRNDPSTPSDRSPSTGSSSGRTHVLHSLTTGNRVRHFTTMYRQSVSMSENISRSSRPTPSSRCCPAFLVNPSHSRISATIPAASLPQSRRLSDRFLRASVFSSLHAPQASVGLTSALTTGEAAASHSVPLSSLAASPSREYVGSAFSDLLSLSYPQHAEFMAAMNDALKTYAGSLFTSDDELSGPSLINTSSRSDRDHPPRRDGPAPPSTGNSTCAS